MPPSLPFPLQLLRRFRRAGGCSAALLVGVLVLASLLGVLHAITHPPERLLAHDARNDRSRSELSSKPNKTALAGKALNPASAATAPSWLGTLFHHMAGELDCRIFDRLCHGPAAPVADAQVLSFALPTAAVLMTLEGEYIARWSAFFDARGPPART